MWADLITPYPRNIWWGPGAVYITSDYVIEEGVKLTIFPGTVVIFDTTDAQEGGSDSSKCELIVQGTLSARGTEQDSIYFLSVSSTPSDSDWQGIIVQWGGTAQLSYCNIQSAYTGIKYVNSSVDTVSHCLFRNNLEHGLRIENDGVLVDECTIEKD
jgi:hypothetical protein